MLEANNSVTTPPTAYRTYLRLLGYLKPLALPFVISIMGFAIFAASNPMLAKLMESTIQAIEHKNADARWTLPVLAIGIFLIRGFGTFLGTYFNARVSQRLIVSIRIDIFNHLTTLPVSYFSSRSDGQIIQRISGGVGLVSSAVTDGMKIIVREGLSVVFLLTYAFYLNWQMSLVFLAIAPFILLLARYTTLRFRSITRRNESVMGGLLQCVKEMISGNEVMRIFGGQAHERGRYKKVIDKTLANMMRIQTISALSAPVMQLLVATALATIIFLLLQPHTLAVNSTGELIGYLTTVAMIPKSMRQLSGVNLIIQRGISGAQLIFELLDTKPEEDKGTFECERAKGVIHAKNIRFRYDARQEDVLKDVSFDIRPGEMVALVGKSGGGKSTLVSLLQRFYDVADGSIAIDGVDIRDYKLANLRKQISVVSQNLILFNDTIRNNIAYGSMSGSSDEQILTAARNAYALEFILAQPKGLDTIIGDNGLQLSGGQRQRIAIARAFLKDAPILILDEATSALDNESEQNIQQAIDSIMKGRSTLVIAHRLSTIERANKILVLNKGCIVEQGSHLELLNKKGLYASLYTGEFEK